MKAFDNVQCVGTMACLWPGVAGSKVVLACNRQRTTNSIGRVHYMDLVGKFLYSMRIIIQFHKGSISLAS